MACRLLLIVGLVLWCLSAVFAEEKFLLLESAATRKAGLEVLPDGSRVYVAANNDSYLVFDANGQFLDRYSCALRAVPRDLTPITRGELAGWFVSFNTYFSARVALYRPDGSEAKVLISVKGNETGMRGDRGGDASPIAGGTVDDERGIIFLLDHSRNTKRDIDWSRIAMFDLSGKFLGDVRRFNLESTKDDERDLAWQTYYYDIEVDPARQLCYVTTDKRTGNEMLVLSYDPARRGEVVGRVPGRCGIALLPNGRVAVLSDDFKQILVYDAALQLAEKIPVNPVMAASRAYELSRSDLEADAQGRLYMNGGEADISYARWSADFATVEYFGPQYRKLEVNWPAQAMGRAGESWKINAKLIGRPQPEAPNLWQVFLRPSDGSDLRFQQLTWEYAQETLTVTLPAAAQGFYDVFVRYGEGSFSPGNRAGELFLQRTIAIAPAGAASSVAVVTANCRRAYRQGEAIPMQLVARGPVPAGEMRVELRRGVQVLGDLILPTVPLSAYVIPASVTRRLLPGEYHLTPVVDGAACYALPITIASMEADSPFQRILYHEFGNAPIVGASGGDTAERMDALRNYLRVTSALGFTRETCRAAGNLRAESAGARYTPPAPLTDTAFAPADYYPLTLGRNNAEYYLDQAVGAGIVYDTQYVGHCGSPSFAASSTEPRLQIFQRVAQSWGRFPSFYGMNYNDEMFDGGLYAKDLSGWDNKWMAADSEALRERYLTDFSERPLADALNASMRDMYKQYNAAVRQVRPNLNLTTTPMWQHPAVEGVNPPDVYADMSESYSHWMSEGYAMPWYSVHSAESFKRPGLPMMGVFDNGHLGVAGDLYMKNALLVAARGMQGTGIQHYAPLGTVNKSDHYGAPAYRLINALLKQFGPVFAEVPTANEGAILYSYSQDVSERRHAFGTPHWERVYELYGYGLMAGVPMNIICEEDMLAGWLMDGRRTRVPMLLLTGQTQPLPAPVRASIRKFTDAGGKIIVLKDPDPETPAIELAPFSTGFEEGQPAPAANPQFRVATNVLGASCRVQAGAGRNGGNGLLLEGKVVNVARAQSTVTVSALPRAVAPNTRISYWMKPLNRLGRNVMLDVYFAVSGANWLRDMGACDSTGRLLRPNIPRGKVGEWFYVEAPIGRWCAGMPIRELALSFAADDTGEFACVIDDIRVFEGEPSAAEAAGYAERLPGARVVRMETWACKEAWNLGNNDDSWQPYFQPIMERQAALLKEALGKDRRFPLDTDDPWVSKNQFDGGAVRYLMVASETSPYPWDAAGVWSLGAAFCKSKDTWLPKRVHMSFPAQGGVVYDMFEHRLVTPAVADNQATLSVDLTLLPGRLFALAPAPLGAPRLATALQDSTVHYRARVLDALGKDMAARVPLRIRLMTGETVVSEIFRASDAGGLLSGQVALPFSATASRLEISELLGGQTTAVDIPMPVNEAVTFFAKRDDVDIQRETQLRALLSGARGTRVMLANDAVLDDGQRQALTVALQAEGITLQSGALPPAGAGLYLAVGMGSGNTLGTLLQLAAQRALFEWPLTESTPGTGRGMICPLFSVRSYGEHVIALVGGDEAGLAKSVQAFINWLKMRADAPVAAPALKFVVSGEAIDARLSPLSAQIGPHLRGLAVTPDGARLLVTANGYQKNLALIEDLGAGARVVRSERVAQSPWLQRQYLNWAVPPHSGYLSPDGRYFGASGRVLARHGEEFRLFDANGGVADTFASFGDIGRFGFHQFAVSNDGQTVIAPGVYGLFCWKRNGDAWQESWAIEGWKNFTQLNWPVSNSAETMPQYHVSIPHGADYAIMLYFESIEGGWVTPDNAYPARVAAVNLSDGAERWRLELSNMKELVMPLLVASPDGSKLLCRMQIGGWGREYFRYLAIDAASGVASPAWEMTQKPETMTVANGSGWSAIAGIDRLLEVRRADGSLVYSLLWPGQPVSLAFAEDGKSVYVIDSLGEVSALDDQGDVKWTRDLGCQGTLAATPGRVYAACWDGRVRALTSEGTLRWTLDMSADMQVEDPQAMMVAAGTIPGKFLQAHRPPTTSAVIPEGENMLRTGKATITVGGTGGWASSGTVQVKADELCDGIFTLAQPWASMKESFWVGQSGRQLWAEIAFPEPTDVGTLTVYETQQQPRSWPTDAVVQRWDEDTKSWVTAAYGAFLSGPVNSYALHLKGVTKLRYVPWNNSYYNYYTSEIEVRK